MVRNAPLMVRNALLTIMYAPFMVRNALLLVMNKGLWVKTILIIMHINIIIATNNTLLFNKLIQIKHIGKLKRR